MNETDRAPVIKKWRLTFIDGTPKNIRENSHNEIIRFARGMLSGGVLEVRPCYSLVGKIYGGDYPEGHEVITHTVTKMTNITGSSLAKTIAGSDQMVLIVNTCRDEEYYLVVERYDTVC